MIKNVLDFFNVLKMIFEKRVHTAYSYIIVGSSPYWCFPLHILLHDEALVVIAVQVEADTFIIAREEMNMSFENGNTARMEN